MPIDGVNSSTVSGIGSANRLITAFGARVGRLGPLAESRPVLEVAPTDSVEWAEAVRTEPVDVVDLVGEPGAAEAAAFRPFNDPSLSSHPWNPIAGYRRDAQVAATVASAAQHAAGTASPSTATSGVSTDGSSPTPGAAPATDAAGGTMPLIPGITVPGEQAPVGRSRVIFDRDTAHGDAMPLSEEEQAEVDRLAEGDAEIRRHEEAHLSAAGSLAVSGPHYEYVTGPDGRRYAVGGEVNIDSAPVQGDPQATIAKMQQVRRAALAPAEPSSADRAVARKAMAYEQDARRQLIESGSSDPNSTPTVSTGSNDADEAALSFSALGDKPADASGFGGIASASTAGSISTTRANMLHTPDPSQGGDAASDGQPGTDSGSSSRRVDTVTPTPTTNHAMGMYRAMMSHLDAGGLIDLAA